MPVNVGQMQSIFAEVEQEQESSRQRRLTADCVFGRGGRNLLISSDDGIDIDQHLTLLQESGEELLLQGDLEEEEDEISLVQ